jgi:hypothetical protein
MTREEHLQWCKDRAMEYVKAGNLVNAVASMMDDLTKHPETQEGPALATVGLFAALQAYQGDKDAVRRYILGFR